MKLRLIIIVLFLIFVFRSFVFALTNPTVFIKSMQTMGSGCAQGSTSVAISPDAQTFSILFDNFISQSNLQALNNLKNCRVSVEFELESGWSFSIVGAEHRGFASFDAGTSGSHQALYTFSIHTPRNDSGGFDRGKGYVMKKKEFVGPFQDNYYEKNSFNIRETPWSPCNFTKVQTLFIHTSLETKILSRRAANANAMLALDSIDGSLSSQNYEMRWRRCTANNPDNGNERRPPRIGGSK